MSVGSGPKVSVRTALSTPERHPPIVSVAFRSTIDAEFRAAGIELSPDICRRHDIDKVFYYPSTGVRFSALLSGGDDRLSLQLPKEQAGPLPAGLGLPENRGGRDPAAIVSILQHSLPPAASVAGAILTRA